MNDFHVARIPILPFGLVNAHLIVQSGRCVLVDTGLPGSERKIASVLGQYGLDFRDIKLIVVTHAHVDHAGSAASIRALSNAPVVAHEGDAKFLNRELPMTFCPTGWFGRSFIRTRLMFEPYEGFKPDILLSDAQTLRLEDYGFVGRVKHTPGHTAGSISVELPSKEALVGDLIASGVLLGGLILTGRAKRPPFEDDPQLVADHLQGLADAGADTFYMGHGGPLCASEVRRHIQSLRRK